jgi:hypothetical protein
MIALQALLDRLRDHQRDPRDGNRSRGRAHRPAQRRLPIAAVRGRCSYCSVVSRGWLLTPRPRRDARTRVLHAGELVRGIASSSHLLAVLPNKPTEPATACGVAGSEGAGPDCGSPTTSQSSSYCPRRDPVPLPAVACGLSRCRCWVVAWSAGRNTTRFCWGSSAVVSLTESRSRRPAKGWLKRLREGWKPVTGCSAHIVRNCALASPSAVSSVVARGSPG